MRNVFKNGFLAVAFCCLCSAGFAWEWADGYKLIDLGGMRMAIFNRTESKDGFDALGWTLVQVDKKSKPVDWSLWDKDNGDSMNAWKFLDHYDWDTRDNRQAPYELVNCVVDFQHKKILALPTDSPGGAQSAHGDITVVWGPVENGRRHAFVNNEARFGTGNFWLVTIDQNGMRQMELAPRLTKQALHVVLDKRPDANVRAYEEGVVLGANRKGDTAVFHAQSADIPFDADVPKYSDSTSEVQGWITVRLPEGTIAKAWSDTPLDDPFVNDPDLKKADDELNKTYAALLRTTKPAAREDLKKEQREWIQKRDGDASDAESNARENNEDRPTARNKSLLESTLERTAELKARLSGH